MFVLLSVGLVALVWYLWSFHCLFFWHKWDFSRKVTDRCVRCGAIRFK